MVSSARQGYESTVRIEKLKAGNLRLAFSTKLATLFNKPEGTTHRVSAGLIDSSGNYAALESKCWLMHNDYLSGEFDNSLEKYGIKNTKQKVTFITTAPVQNKTLLEIWDLYVENLENKRSLNTLNKLKKHWRNTLLETINKVGENPLAIRNFLIENKTFAVALEVLRNLEKSNNEAIKRGLRDSNLFEGMCSDFNAERRSNTLSNDHTVSDEDVNNIELAYSLDEMNLIITEFYNQIPGTTANLIKFMFLTGTRISEAIAVKWSDIKWKRECIIICRQWIDHAQCFAPLKGTKKLPERKQYRVFPMPKDESLWRLMKTIVPIDHKLDLVFLNDKVKPFRRNKVWEAWADDSHNKKHGIVKRLVQEKRLSKYLSIHHTRHTFSCIQQNIYDIDAKVVSSWIGHHPEVNEKHYWEADKQIKPQYDSSDKSEIELLREQLKQQQKLINKLIQEKT
jgi:integrase